MKWNWRKIGTGLKVILNIAVDLNEAKLIKVKELDKVKQVKDIIEKDLPQPQKPL